MRQVMQTRHSDAGAGASPGYASPNLAGSEPWAEKSEGVLDQSCAQERYGYADRRVLADVRAWLKKMKDAGYYRIRVLDLGCGDGEWLRRIVGLALASGFARIDARGIDISAVQINDARRLSADISTRSEVHLDFAAADICDALAERDHSVDLCLCIGGVLNELDPLVWPGLMAEIGRVTSGLLVVSWDNHALPLRAGSTNQDRTVKRPDQVLPAEELRSLVSVHLDVLDLVGLDLFHGRLTSDPRWSGLRGPPPSLDPLLDGLEESHCRDRAYMDRASELLLLAEARGWCV